MTVRLRRPRPARAAVVGTLALAALAALPTAGYAAPAHGHGHAVGHTKPAAHRPATPIQHLVVIYQENVSFDHYFGTYPKAANTDGSRFTAARNTPAIDGLLPATSSSLPRNLRHANDLTRHNNNAALPQRLDSTPTGAPGSAGGQLTCDQDHEYTDEQRAFDGGRMDKFVQTVGTSGGTVPGTSTPCQAKTVMDYYDGNTVTGLWNYAQHYAMSDNSYNSTFGPSSPGALNLISGNTGNVDAAHMVNNPSIATPADPNAELTPDGKGGYSMIGDPQPYWDDCSTRDAVGMNGTNIGDVLNAQHLSWGWFEGGMRPTTSYADALAATGHSGQPTSTFIPNEFKGSPAIAKPAHAKDQGICNAVHPVGAALGGSGQYGYKDDYIAHHAPFQYYPSTANPHHLTLPTDANGAVTLAGLRSIGTDTQSYAGGAPQFNTPNHNYDTSDFEQLMSAINRGKLPPSALPAVSFLKAPGYQDGHGAYSDPADEQAFVTRQINALMKSPDWSSTAIVVNYDDSDGWYDHANAGVRNGSLSPADALNGPGQCGPAVQKKAPLAGEQGRCGYGPRLPLLVISPFAPGNHVDHNLSNQASMINFVEYNWGLAGLPGSFDQAQKGIDAQAKLPFDLAGLFDFKHRTPRLLLNPSTGQPVR